MICSRKPLCPTSAINRNCYVCPYRCGSGRNSWQVSLGSILPGFVAQVVAFAFGLAASSFFPAIFLGIFDKRTNRQGAIAGMVSGILFTAIYIIYFKFIFEAPVGASAEDYWWFGISPEGIGTLGMLINLVITIAVSRLTPAPSEEIQDMVENIRIPRGAGKAQGGH